MALAGAVRSTLGPLGQDKLLIDDEGRTMVTNDGVLVLESAKVEHPVANMLINASTTQDRIARDGTTSAVLLSAELLQNAWELVLQGVHPSAIARGYRHAEELAEAILTTSSSRPTKNRCWQQRPLRSLEKSTKPCSIIWLGGRSSSQGRCGRTPVGGARRPHSCQNPHPNGRFHERFVVGHRLGVGQATGF